MLVALPGSVDKKPKSLFTRRELLSIEDAVNDFASEILRGDRRVRPGSKEAGVLA